MEYIVIEQFADLLDNGYAYRPGDTFPRDGKDVSQERIAELSSNNNKLHRALIAKVEADAVVEVEPETVAEVDPDANRITKEVDVDAVEAKIKEYSKEYTRNDINHLTGKKLRPIAEEIGIDNPEQYTVPELKDMVATKLGH